MPYRILDGERPADALRRIAAEQIDSALEAVDGDLDLHETVHEVRKRCKKIRALLRLFRGALPCYREENVWFRDAARQLSEPRDAGALVEACDALVERFAEDLDGEPLFALRKELVRRRDAVAQAFETDHRLGVARDALRKARLRLDDWSLEAEGFDAIAHGLEKVQRRARKGLRRARREPSVETLHEWRKRVKYHRYHLRLLREAWPPVLGPLRDAAKRLSDRLGDDHDLAVLHRVVVVDEWERFPPVPRDLVAGLIPQRRKELQAWSLPEARRLIDEPPGRMTRRLRRIWEAWSLQQQLDAALPDGSEAVS